MTLALRFENVELLPEVQLPHDPRQTTTSTVHGLRYRVPAMADVRLVVGAREVRSLTVPLPQFGRVAELAPDEALDAKGRWLYRIDPADGSLHAVSVDGL